VLILLPPSETKRDGGAGSPLDLDRLSFPSLNPVRREVVDAVVALAADRDAAMRALKLGPKQADEVDRNRAIPGAPTMRALERYTGILYDALGASSLSAAEWAVASGSVVVQSAMLGLVGAHWGMRLITNLLYGVTPLDPASFAVGAAVLIGAALMACVVPTRRALAVDPMTAIRAE